MKTSKLEKAIRAGDLDQLRELIEAGTDLDAAFEDGTTPVQLAASERQITLLRALAGAGADLGVLDDLSFQERLTLFFEAAADLRDDDDLMTLEELTEWVQQAKTGGMDPRLAAEIAEMEGVLNRAVRTGDMELLREGIAAGEDVDQVRAVTLDTPLTLAVQERDEEMVRELIAAGADINHVGYGTPLTFALPDLEMAKLLIDAGADLYARGLDRRTPLERAVHRSLCPSSAEDSPILVRFLLEAGVHPPTTESIPGDLLMEAEYSEAWEVYQELLPHYPEEVARESFEELASHQWTEDHDGGLSHWAGGVRYAAQEGRLEELQELLAERAEEIAAAARAERKYGRDNAADEAGKALRDAISALQLKAARLLIDAGAALDVESYESRRGSTPLACAAESWHRRSKEALRLLLDAGARVDGTGRFGRTPLMYAVLLAYRHGAPLAKAVPLLLAAGADPNLEDEYGHTAWALARAPLIEEEERPLLGAALGAHGALGEDGTFFDGPDLSDLFSDAANQADGRRSRLDRCRQAAELLAAAGAEARGEAELRLVLAAAAGNAERMGELLAAGAGVEARSTDGTPAILLAARSGSGDAVARLIAAGCNVDASVAGGPDALDVAVERADLGLTRQLIDGGANVVMFATMSHRILSATAAKASENPEAAQVVELIRGLLPPQFVDFGRGVDEEIASDDRYWDAIDSLPRQAAAGDLDQVRELLAIKDVKVDGFDPLRRTALSAAAEAGQVEMVRELIALGAEVDKCNGVVGSPRSTPLACAAISSSPQRDAVLRLLLSAGADPDRLGADGRTALMHAVERDVGFFGRTGDFALSTRTLIAAGADLEIRDPYGLTAWMRAKSLASSIALDEVAGQYEAVADLLEEAGAVTDGLPAVELIWALVSGEDDRVRELIAAGADPNARRHDGATALMLAVRDGERELARLLLSAGADARARQWLDRGPTAADAATDASQRKMLRLLVAAGAEVPDDKVLRSRSPRPIREE